jgi:hypothetical protein
MADSTCRKQGLSPRDTRGVAKRPCKASFFARVFFCLVPALARLRFDVLPEIVQDRLPAIRLLLLGMGLLGAEHHHHIEAFRHPRKGEVRNAVAKCVVDPFVRNDARVRPGKVEARAAIFVFLPCATKTRPPFRLPETVGSSFLHRACPSLQRQLAVRYNRQQFP